jgi:hypothetical protein
MVRELAALPGLATLVVVLAGVVVARDAGYDPKNSMPIVLLLSIELLLSTTKRAADSLAPFCRRRRR